MLTCYVAWPKVVSGRNANAKEKSSIPRILTLGGDHTYVVSGPVFHTSTIIEVPCHMWRCFQLPVSSLEFSQNGGITQEAEVLKPELLSTTLPALRSAASRWGAVSVIHFDSHLGR